MDDYNNYFCFRVGELSRRVGRYWNNRFSDLGITLVQSYVLLSLLRRDGQCVKDIACDIKLDSSAVTGLIDRLMKENLVIRREDADDRRSLQVFLTDTGREKAEAALEISGEANRFCSGMLEGNEIDRLFAVQEELEKRGCGTDV